jgi:hypothetical protein
MSHMFFYRADNPLPKSQPGTESEVTELRMVGAFYTYFGWFPWADFEGESFSEGKVYQLTGGQAGAPVPAVAVGTEVDRGEETEPLV